MPPDRVFGRVEKDYRKKEEILLPKEYLKILNNHGKLNVCGQDWKMLDYKTISQGIVNKKMPFKMLEARVLTYKKQKKRWCAKFVHPTPAATLKWIFSRIRLTL